MIITIKNLGVIKKAEFDTSKKLTLFCGPNSTGKTYLAYVIYAIFSNSEPLKLKSFNNAKSLFEGDTITIKNEDIDEFLSKKSALCKKNIGEIFGIAEDREHFLFKNFNISFSLSDKEINSINEFGIDSDLQNFIKDTINKKQLTYDYWWSSLLHMSVFSGRTFMFPVERNSIYTFKTELSLNRNQLVDAILDHKNEWPSVAEMLGQKTRRYPLVIKDNLNIANDLETIQKHKSIFYKFAEEIEQQLLQGIVFINQNGEVYYKTQNDISIPISIASSIVKTLSSLIVSLKYQVSKGKNLLIIDEPEMNLHPDSQVLLAKILAKISNKVPMIISTHSDYIIRELNNMIVAKSLDKKGNEAYKKYYDKDSLLDYKDVQVLYFDFSKDGKVIVKKLDIDQYGFAVDSIDDTINSQNERMQNLFSQMED